MVFNSWQFMWFFPLFLLGYFALHKKGQLAWLLVGSCYFYMALIPKYILVLFGLILLDYFAARWLEPATGKKRKRILILSLSGNLLVLGFFKYFNFFNGSAQTVAQWMGLHYSVSNLTYLLPIGLSFHTFQSMAYTIEVYRGRQVAERNLLKYALYVLFWPQLVAGPIERPGNLLPQLSSGKRFDPERVVDGLRLMLLGFFKKVVIADNFAFFVWQVFDKPGTVGGISAWLAIYAFSFQIYFDFSGYSDIAIGAARVCGYRLSQNFSRPYAARSVADFWRRWHISLSTWFRDYVYLPLGGKHPAFPRYSLNILIVFVLSGFWHGASWTFLLWGLLHGVYLIVYQWIRPVREKIEQAFRGAGLEKFWSWVCVGVTFNLIALTWVFFRADSIASATLIFKSLFRIHQNGEASLYTLFVPVLAMLFLGLLGRGLPEGVAEEALFCRGSWRLRWGLYYALGLSLLLLGDFYYAHTFIYFQF